MTTTPVMGPVIAKMFRNIEGRAFEEISRWILGLHGVASLFLFWCDDASSYTSANGAEVIGIALCSCRSLGALHAGVGAGYRFNQIMRMLWAKPKCRTAAAAATV